MDSYRQSHTSEGYGKQYERVYDVGYYRAQWELIERPLLRETLAELSQVGVEPILDFACGTGRILQVLEEFASEPVGLDISESMLSVASEKCTSSKLICSDITTDDELAQELANTFKCVTSFRFFTNAESQLRASALDAIGALLADDGLFISNVHQNSSSPLGIAYRLRDRVRPTQARTMGLKEYTALLKQHGFEIVSVHHYSYLPRPGWSFSGLVAKLILPVERLAQKLRVPKSLCQSFLVVARKST